MKEKDIKGHVTLATLKKGTYNKLVELALLPTPVRDHNVGSSDYSRHFIQPWSIWQDYNLNPWDADIIKRVLREKEGTPRIEDYKKIIHVCEERIRQLSIKAEEEAQP